MRLTTLCVCGILLAFSSLSWTSADHDEADLPGDRGFRPCTATLIPDGPCRLSQDGSSCPYLFTLPPLTVHLPMQLIELETIVKDLQKLKDNVDQLRMMCADCTVSQTERECGKQREREHEKLNEGTDRHKDERKWLNERNPERPKDFSQGCGTNRVKEEKTMGGNGDTVSEKITTLEQKEKNKLEAEREGNKEVIKENWREEDDEEKVAEKDGKSQSEGAKGKDKPGQTAGGNDRIVDLVPKKVVVKNNDSETSRNKETGMRNSNSDQQGKPENGKERKIAINIKNRMKTEEREHHVWQDQKKETEKKTQTGEDRGSDGIKMSEDPGEHTDKGQEQPEQKRKKEMEKGIKVERNNEKSEWTEEIGHAEKEKTIKEGEAEEDGERETGKEIKTGGEKTAQSVQRDSDRELASSEAIERPDFVSISVTPHSTISLGRDDFMDSNEAITITSSLPSHSIADGSQRRTITADGLLTQSTGLGAAGISEQPSPDEKEGFGTTSTTTATMSSLGGPGQQITSATTSFTSITGAARPDSGFQSRVSSTAFPRVANRNPWAAKRNISSNTKTGMKPPPGRGAKPGERHGTAIKPEAHQRLKNLTNDRKPEQAHLLDKKTKHDLNQKPPHQNPTNDQKAKPGKDPYQVQILKPDQISQPDNYPTDQDLKKNQTSEHEPTTDRDKLPIQKPKFQPKSTLPVQRPTSHQRPQTVNATGSDIEPKSVQDPTPGQRPDQKLKPRQKIPQINQKPKPGEVPQPNLKHIELATGQKTKPNVKTKPDQTPKFQPKSTLPVQRPTSHQRPQTVNATGSDKDLLTEQDHDSVEIGIINENLKPGKKPGQTLQTDKPDQKKNPQKKLKSEEKTKPDQRITLNRYLTPDQEPKPEGIETTSLPPKPNQTLVTESLEIADEDPSIEPKSVQDPTPGQTPDQKLKPRQKIPQINQKPKPGEVPQPNQKHIELATGQKTKPNVKTKPDQTPKFQPKSTLPVQRPTSHQRPQTVNATGSDKDLLTEQDHDSVEIGIINENSKPGKKPGQTLQTDKPDQKKNPHKKLKPDQRITLNRYLTPDQEPKPEGIETTSLPPKPNQMPVTESLEIADEDPSIEPKSVQDPTPGQTPDQKLKPRQKIPQINQKPKPGEVPQPNQKHIELATGQKTKPNVKTKPDQTPKTNQGLKKPRPDQMPKLKPKPVLDEIPKEESSNKTFKPRLDPRHRQPSRPTVKPGATPVQRPKPAVQLKPSPKTKTNLDPRQTSRTTSDGVQNSQIDMRPASGPVKLINEATHSPGETEFSSGEKKTNPLGPKTSSGLEPGPFPSLPTLSEGFTMSPNSRITSDLRPHISGQPSLIPVTTRPNNIMRGILPSTSPGSTKPNQVSNTDSSFQAKTLTNVEKTVPRKIADTQKIMVSVLLPSAKTTSTTTPATSGPEPLDTESSTPSARELRVKINQVAAFFENSPKGHPEDNQRGNRPDRTDSKLPTSSKVSMAKRDCSDHRLRGAAKSGIYLVTPDLRGKTFPVFCDMELGGGGWTVLQRRQDGSLSFNRTWADYRLGFGEVDATEFWLGNNMIHMLTRDRDMVLRVELVDYDGVKAYAEYAQFRVASERMRYRLTVDGYSGTAGDALRFSKSYDHNNRAFTTPDRDHDRYPSGNCGAYYSSGWWFDACLAANLNGRYYVGTYKGVRDGIFWGTWHNISTEYYPTNDRRSFKTVSMMTRPKGFAS